MGLTPEALHSCHPAEEGLTAAPGSSSSTSLSSQIYLPRVSAVLCQLCQPPCRACSSAPHCEVTESWKNCLVGNILKIIESNPNLASPHAQLLDHGPQLLT